MNNKIRLKMSSRETIDTPPTEIVERNVTIEEDFIKNKDLIRIDLNLIQLPIFSKDTHRKVNQIVKYYFNKNRDTFLSVSPQVGEYIPGEMEEKVFIALMQLMKERDMERKIIVTSMDLKDKLKLNSRRYIETIEKSLSRLSGTNYTFKNTLYVSELKKVLNKKVETSIFNITTIYLDYEKNKEYRRMFRDKRIKTVYEIEFSEHFYNNIIRKGYMVYNGNTLLQIESSVARSIYMIVEKLRFDKLYLKIDTIFLIRRIPLKDDNETIDKTVIVIKKALEELVSRGLIKSYFFIKPTTWKNSDIEIMFHESANDEKQKRFFEDKNDFRKILSFTGVSETECEMITEAEIVQPRIKVTKEVIDNIINMMPTKAKILKTLPKTVKESIERYGVERVEAVAQYMKQKKVDKIRAYFIKALSEDWEIEIEQPKEKAQPIQFIEDEEPKISQLQLDEALVFYDSASEEEREEIESATLNNYVKACGSNTKAQQVAFKRAKRRLIAEYIIENLDIEATPRESEKFKIDNPPEEDRNIDFILENKKYVEATIATYKMLFNLSQEEVQRLETSVLIKLTPLILNGTASMEHINKLLESEMTNLRNSK